MITLDGTRTILLEDGLAFTVEPESFQTFAATLANSMQTEGLDEQGRAYLASGLSMIERISAWSGVALPDGSLAECTKANKMQLFGKRPDLLNAISKALEEADASAEKNLPTSPGG